MFTLRFKPSAINHWAARNTDQTYKAFEQEIAPNARSRGYLTQAEFLSLCEWKSPRSRQRCRANTPGLVEEATRFAFQSTHERLRIGSLLSLDGVSWPTASVLLHFCSGDPYPILDFRALWSLRTPQPSAYNFDFWWRYVQCCRELAERNRVSMRTLDLALWQYSKERQPL